MTGYWSENLKETLVPQVDGVAALNGGDSDSSEGVRALIEATDPERIAQAGRNYLDIARMCADSVAELSTQARVIAETLGGESLRGIFETIKGLQQDLARIQVAATSVGTPLEWYGTRILPWFRDNIPGTGNVSLDDDLFDSFGNVENNGHALARHHLRLLNAYIRDVHWAIGGHLEQRSKAPQVGVADPSLTSPKGVFPPSLTGDPYAGSSLGSPYGHTPGLTGPDLPGYNDPALQKPSLPDPSLRDPSQQDPSLQTPSPNSPRLDSPNVNTPNLNTPNLNTPTPDPSAPKTPDLSPAPSPTTLATVPPATVPTSTVPTSTGPYAPLGTAAATQLGAAGAQPPSGPRTGAASGMGMGMIPPMMGGAGSNQEQDRERARLPLVEDEAFETDDMGGPSVIA
ncbi:MAG: hypothetical protein HOW59_00365 [Nonomuraea sp.]|nr:hypothetical protein [Nonomuraea sp.]